MEQLDSTVLATALPAMARDLHEDPIALKLALTAYLLSLAIFIPLSGWAADKFGARRVFCAAIVVFVIGSILCAFSNSLATIVAARTVQGLGGALMVPVGRLVVLRTAPRHELVQAMAWLAIPALIGPVIGPPFGGFLATYAHWRYIFWINVPIGLLGVMLATRYVPDLTETHQRPLDRRGAFLSGVGLCGLVFGFTIGGRGLVATPVVALILIVGALALVAYVRHARKTVYPILDLGLLGIPTFRAAILGGFLFRVGLGATPFLLPLLLQEGFHLTPLQSGLLTFAGAVGAIAMKTTAQPIINRFGFRSVLIVNALISAGFLFSYAFFTPATPQSTILFVVLIGGFFRSLEFTALNAIAFADVSQRDMSNAASFAAVGQQLALSTGVAIGAAALETSRGFHGGGQIVADDFSPAFCIVAGITALAPIFFRSLPLTAGDELMNRRKLKV
jgi:EmrB/QacA subfamily drug resistance transporter